MPGGGRRPGGCSRCSGRSLGSDWLNSGLSHPHPVVLGLASRSPADHTLRQGAGARVGVGSSSLCGTLPVGPGAMLPAAPAPGTRFPSLGSGTLPCSARGSGVRGCRACLLSLRNRIPAPRVVSRLKKRSVHLVRLSSVCGERVCLVLAPPPAPRPPQAQDSQVWSRRAEEDEASGRGAMLGSVAFH